MNIKVAEVKVKRTIAQFALALLLLLGNLSASDMHGRVTPVLQLVRVEGSFTTEAII